MNKFDRIWPRLTRVVAFVGGMGIMVYETVGDRSDRPWLYAAAVGMMGLPIARVAEQVLGKIGGTGMDELYETKQQQGAHPAHHKPHEPKAEEGDA